ncbi:DUF2911 domain-containing protein [Sphingobacterium sp. SYP-B4668]|uniref:DUF2911 domain-containing protein n=1 Tax=Sphingobacterium sp. SYP-B4668 TaxID=2996035 RepID=UPI0022DD22ED|nr:DUF2911 domain-containing protein [Sphingobacterium sp. SYP-B4668]
MRTPILFLFAMLLSIATFAQTDKAKRPSPPANTKITTNDGVTIDINYSSPSLKGRQIGVDVAERGKVWRTGANEATTLEIDKDVMVEGKKLAAGKYGLFTIPGEKQTTVILNKVWDQWGNSKYDQAQDVLRIDVKNTTASAAQEQFKINADKSGKISLIWGTYSVPFNIKKAK